MFCKQSALAVCLVFSALLSVQSVSGSDWPMWRYDANRSAASPEELAAELHLQWVREYPPLEPAWPDEPRMRFDAGYEPIVMGKTMFVGSSRNDSVTALDTDTGAEKWRFYADGPVRFAPVAWRDKLYFAADDGCLYCLNATNGSLLWKFRKAPSARKVIGNERLISTWPARGGPVVADGKVYFAAGIWPFMGVFIYALDAETGNVLWINDGSGSMYINQPHDSPAFAGVAPQGYLVAIGDKLLVPNGRAVAAGFDRNTGEFLYFHHATNKSNGNSHTAAIGEHFTNSGCLFDLTNGRKLKAINTERDTVLERIKSDQATHIDLTEVASEPVLTDEVMYIAQRNNIRALDITQRTLPELWSVSSEAKVRIMAGRRLYASAPNVIMAVDLPEEGGEPTISWTENIEGTPSTMLAADGKLFVVTLEGRIYCFGENPAEVQTIAFSPTDLGQVGDEWSTTADNILKQTGVTEGYCLALGVGTGRLVEELARQSSLHIIALDPDATKVEALRKRLDAADLYGTRIALHVGDILSSQLAPYLASLIVSEDLSASGVNSGVSFAKEFFRVLRPYGGVACLSVPPDQLDLFAEWIADPELANAELRQSGTFSLLERVGALPGSADWTHQYADAANTVVSKDKLVKAPLGVLWFGGSSNTEILPRHGHGPSEQVAAGRLFIEGPDIIRALDVYTGRVLWQVSLPEIGKAYNYTSHEPGASSVGSNYVSLHDGVYVAYGPALLCLDPATGEKISEFTLPPKGDATTPPDWGYIGVWEDLLIAGSEPLIFDPRMKVGTMNSWNAISSKHLVVMNRYSGDVLWSQEAESGFHHNSIAVAGGKVFCIDRLPESVIKTMERRGETFEGSFTLLALDTRDGTPIWSKTENIFGTWLGYSEEYDILLQAGRPSRDMLPEPGDRMIAYQGEDGTVVWDKAINYEGPCMLHGETIITQSKAFDLLTGEVKMRKHPLTGELIPWSFTRNYGCNTVIASEHLITFRSAAAGYFDLTNNGGTGNIGGFKSGCTSNLIVANGVLNAPDYTRTCNCSYQNSTSLGLVHMPEVEMWTFTSISLGAEPIQRLGINFGAPGDRIADNGTLWLDHPRGTSPSPRVSISTSPTEPESFLHHSSRINGGLSWVAASGIKGATSVTITLSKVSETARPYDVVRLYFAEPEYETPGQRVFDVAIQGQQVLTSFDIFKEAGAPNRTVVKEFKNINIGNDLTLTFEPSDPAKKSVPIISGIEVVAEEEEPVQIEDWILR